MKKLIALIAAICTLLSACAAYEAPEDKGIIDQSFLNGDYGGDPGGAAD